MDDALDVGPLAQNRQMQQNFAASLTAAGNLLALHVDDAQIFGLHKALGDERWRTEHFLLVQPVADVAVVAGGKALVVNPPADVANFKLELMEVHGFGCLGA